LLCGRRYGHCSNLTIAAGAGAGAGATTILVFTYFLACHRLCTSAGRTPKLCQEPSTQALLEQHDDPLASFVVTFFFFFDA
jgi:hypothetical protein